MPAAFIVFEWEEEGFTIWKTETERNASSQTCLLSIHVPR